MIPVLYPVLGMRRANVKAKARLAIKAAREGVGVDAVLGRVVAALESAERAVHRIKPVIERSALDEVARLQEQDRLRVCEAKGILEIEVALSVEVEAGLLRLSDTCISYQCLELFAEVLLLTAVNGDQVGCRADLAGREVPAGAH